ncbi:MAG: hypothetical protein OEZ33_05670 [Gammaproteobacteria bacterium]|nr:hypothetical protein [Gammaproteobacteria bacterium]MDH5777678.1 hypothetical protein [Gammaproteobacteria bacterium]
MNRTLLFIFPILFSGQIMASDVRPSKAEQAKAPAWPIPYSGSPTSCKKADEFLFEKHRSDYQVDAHVDLNLDGQCEIIAIKPEDCTDTGCRYLAFLVGKGRVKDLGQLEFGEYLTPANGWLQLRSKRSQGKNYYFDLYKYVNGKYRLFRTDHYASSDGVKPALYVRTSYRK